MMPMDNWTQFRTAYFVAKLGTVTAAANALGLHRATVIRHVDSLERQIGSKLFQRHAKGYTPTEVGADLLEVAETTERRFESFIMRANGSEGSLSGELVVTAMEVVAEPVMQYVEGFRKEHPSVMVDFLVTSEILRLEYGEAHIAIRASAQKPSEPDNVVQPFLNMRIGIYAARSYIERFGKPDGLREFRDHQFILPGNGFKHICARMIRRHTRDENIAVSFNRISAQAAALRAGIGITFFPAYLAEQDPELVEILPPRKSWESRFWLVTHRDLNRSPKIQAFLKYLRKNGKRRSEFQQI